MYTFKDVKATKLLTEQFLRPECQRFLNNEQVSKITDFQIKYYEKYNNFFLPTQLVL